MKRYDERDVIFSRMARKPGTSFYHAYYTEHPEKKAIDDVLRQRPPMGTKEARYYHPHHSTLVDSTFHLIGNLNQLAEQVSPAQEVVEDSKEQFTHTVRNLALLYGASEVGIAPYDASYYYTHKGRRDEQYGLEITDQLPFTIVFAVEMDYDLFMQSPSVLESVAVTKGYLDAGMIGLVLTYFIKSLGYEARNHMDGNYQMVMPLAAKKAGLGDIGRNGLLISDTHGSRVRLGAVSTNLPLILSPEGTLDIRNFCNACKRCANSCPSKAIDKSTQIDAHYKWQIAQENCYGKWQEFGSDCGLCIARCPFSQKDIKKWIDLCSKPTDEIEEAIKHEIWPLKPNAQW